MAPMTFGIGALGRIRCARMLAPIAPVSPAGTGGASGPGTRVAKEPFAPGMRRGRIAGPAASSAFMSTVCSACALKDPCRVSLEG